MRNNEIINKIVQMNLNYSNLKLNYYLCVCFEDKPLKPDFLSTAIAAGIFSGTLKLKKFIRHK